jgi:hypothetical protein
VLALSLALPLYLGGTPARILGSLPPFDTTLLARSKILIVLALAIAAACGLEALVRGLPPLRRLAALAPLSTAVVLAPLLAAQHPAAPPAQAVFASTPGLEALGARLREDGGRFAGVGWTIPPNVAQAFALEDVRGHFFHEAAYRLLLSAADPSLTPASFFGENGTYLIFHPRTFDASAPILDTLGVTTLALAPHSDIPTGTEAVYRGDDLVLAARRAALPRFRLEPGGAPVEVLLREPTRFRLRLESAAPSRLATSQKRWDPYWTLSLDGNPVAPDDAVFLAAAIPAGSHVVEGRFRIPAVELVVGAIGAVALLFVVARGVVPA